MSLIDTIKNICTDTIKSTKPVEITFASVHSTDPFKIKLDQKLILGTNQLIMANYKVEDFTVGEWVILLRMQGGKKYLVLVKEESNAT